jgi:superfamily II DNA or RNA helicase
MADVSHPSTLRTARQAGITLLPYQLEPAMAIVSGLGSRVLIADEVGLGKTIQAALILSELRARGAVERILILTPAGLRDQWSGELAERFSIGAAIVDMRDLKRRAAALPLGANPWSTIPIAIVSVDFAKRPEILPAIRSIRWDAVVVDEAHHIVPGSDRHEAVSLVASAAPYVVLLTATPHSGDRLAFDALCRIGDMRTDTLLVFRRTRRQAGLGAKRRQHTLMIRPTVEERRMHILLDRFIRTVRAEHETIGRDLTLALVTLNKRALSSARSLEQSVARRLEVLASPAESEPRQFGLPFDDRGELDDGDGVPAWTAVALRDVERERRMLHEIADAAHAAALAETKLKALARLMRRLHARREQAIVFTEYRDTLLHVARTLPYDCAILHGGMPRDERSAALAAFSSGRRRMLLATDAAGEGLNLHQACRIVVNLELPWNPVRLEQRAGRVDRIGQQRTVHAFHLIARDTSETRILQRLRARIATAHEDLEAADPLGLGRDSDDVTVPQFPAGGTANLPPDQTPSRPRAYRRPVLHSKALAEHVRLLRARALVGVESQLVPTLADGASLLTFTRRPRVRATLGAAMLVVVRTVIEDCCGRSIASRLTGAHANTARRLVRSISRSDLARVWPAVEKAARRLGNRSIRTWHQEVARVHRRFWRTRIRRETAIAAATMKGPPPACQPGLFERRALARLLEARNEQDELLEDLNRRLSEARRLAATGRPVSGVVLALVP